MSKPMSKWMREALVAERHHTEGERPMTPAPTPHSLIHGAAGFCTDHAQAPDERVETVARVLRDTRCIEDDANQRILREPTRRESLLIAAAVVAALDDESACSVCDAADEVRADATRHAGWSEAMRFAHHAHASDTSSDGYVSANGVLGAGPDAVIVDGDWLAQVEEDLANDRAALDRVRALVDLMAHGPDRSGEPPLVTQAWTHAADAILAAMGPRDHRTFLHCGFAESHEPHAERDTYCDGSSAALDPEEPR